MKKYLNSVEEVVKALEEGKKVKDEKNEDVYQMVDGIIYGNYNNGEVVINDSIVFTKTNLSTEEPEPLKFEVNRAYKTIGGLKYFLNEINKDNGHLHFIRVDDNYWTNEKGIYTTSEEANVNDFNIAGYWEEDK